VLGEVVGRKEGLSLGVAVGTVEWAMVGVAFGDSEGLVTLGEAVGEDVGVDKGRGVGAVVDKTNGVVDGVQVLSHIHTHFPPKQE
jgi:hypothetical protein